MSRPLSRRSFLQSSAATGSALGLGEWAALAPLSPATAEDARVTPDLVRFGPDIEPVVRLIEDTPRRNARPPCSGNSETGCRTAACSPPFSWRTSALWAWPTRWPPSTPRTSSPSTCRSRSGSSPPSGRSTSFKYHQERGREAPKLKPLAGKLPPADRAGRSSTPGWPSTTRTGSSGRSSPWPARGGR